MNLEADLRAALADSAEGPSRPAPNIDSLLARGERHRRRRAAGRLGGVAAVLSVALAATALTDLDLGGERRPPATGAGPTGSLPSVQPDVRPTLPDSTSEETNTLQPRADIGSFTTVRTGTVYVDVPSAEVVWRSRQGRTKVIGQLGEDAVVPAPKGWFWGRTRAVVGHPSHDLVAWVERVGPRAGQVVVVEASTGKRLATTELEHPLPSFVIITSVDEHVVHFAAPDVEDGPSATAVDLFEPRGDQFWTWPWADDEAPHTSRGSDERVIDVSGDVWAIDTDAGIHFQDASGQSLSTMHPSYTDRTFLGSGLSPDGRFWYGPAYGEVVDTRTGETRALVTHPSQGQQDPVVRGDQVRTSWGWTGPTTMAFGLSGGTGSTAMPKQVPAHRLRPRAVSCTAMSGCCRPTEVSPLRAGLVKRCSTSAGVVPPRLRHQGASVTTVVVRRRTRNGHDCVSERAAPHDQEKASADLRCRRAAGQSPLRMLARLCERRAEVDRRSVLLSIRSTRSRTCPSSRIVVVSSDRPRRATNTRPGSLIQISSTSGSSRWRCSGPKPATASYTTLAACRGSGSAGSVDDSERSS